MKCSRCGNEVGQAETFCGLCGTAVEQAMSAESTHSHPLDATNSNPYYTQLSFESNPSQLPFESHPSQVPFESNPSRPLRSGLLSQSGFKPAPLPSTPTPVPSTNFVPQTPQAGTPSQHGQQQGTGFYHDATEAMSVLPEQTYQPQAPQTPMFLSSFPDTPSAAPHQSGVLSGRLPSATQHGGSGLLRGSGQLRPQSGSYFGSQPQLNRQTGFPPVNAQRPNTPVIIAVICAVLIVFCVIGVIAMYATRSSSTNQTANVTATATKTAPTATPSPSPSPSPTPSPTVVSTPAPPAGYAWCATTCNTNGFETQYPVSWTAGAPANAAGVQFTNPAPTDQFMSYKIGTNNGTQATDLINADLQTNFAPKAGFTPPTAYSSPTIGGVTWLQAIAYYQSDLNPAARERIVVYATNHGGKSYVIELQAQDDQFDALAGQVFTPVLGSFQFVTPPAA